MIHASALSRPTMKRSLLRTILERWLPWYDVDAEAAHDLRSEAIHLESQTARDDATRTITSVRRAYLAAGLRFER